MEILFISPKWEKFKHWPFHMSLLGPLTVAGITPVGHSVAYIDENVENIDFSVRPDVVAISAMTVQARRGYEISHRFLEQGIPVIFGGLHATLLPDDVREHASAVVAGEAELLWPQVLTDFQAGDLKPLYQTAELHDMSCDTFALPRRDLLRTIGYTKTMRGQRVIDTIQAGRGCGRQCPDCNVPLISGRRFRPKAIDTILREINSIQAHFMFFVDDSIPECRDYFIPLFQAMKGMNKRWMSVGALHMAYDHELLSAVRDSGCRVLYIGFDRLNPRWRTHHGATAEHHFYRTDIKKYDIDYNQDFLTNPKPYIEAIQRLKDEGISLIGTFAFGFDHDTHDVFEKSLEFALSSNIDLADFSIVVPYPRSPLAMRFEQQGRILTHDWQRYNGMHVVYKPLSMTPDQLLDGVEMMWREWNRNRPIFRNMIRVFGEKTVV